MWRVFARIVQVHGLPLLIHVRTSHYELPRFIFSTSNNNCGRVGHNSILSSSTNNYNCVPAERFRYIVTCLPILSPKLHCRSDPLLTNKHHFHVSGLGLGLVNRVARRFSRVAVGA